VETNESAKPVFKSTGKKPLAANITAAFAADEFVFREGDLGTEMFIVHEGHVEILKELKGEQRQLAVLEKGDFFGEMSLLEDLPRTASARALSACALLRINGATFDQMLRSNPEIAVRMMRKLSRRLRETDQLLKQALGSTAASAAPEMPTPDEPSESPAAPQRLLHGKSGMEFFLVQSSETTIGRRDPVTGINPDVDLTPVDNQRSISRRHAKIYKQAAKFFVAEEIGTMNGTFVNGTRIETGVPMEIKEGDEVRFGVVETVFHLS
jgi:CRP-like cAMP-binding protein